MAFSYSDHSGSSSDGSAQPKHHLGSVEPSISWPDINQTDGLKYGKGADARKDEPVASADEETAKDKHGMTAPPLASLDSRDFIDTSFPFSNDGLLAAGASPLKLAPAVQESNRGSDFFTGGVKYDGNILAQFQGVSLYDSQLTAAASKPKVAPTVEKGSGSPLARLLANRKDSNNVADAVAAEAPPKFLPITEISMNTGGSLPPDQAKVADLAKSKLDIGLAVAPGERVHDPAKVARAVVRLSEDELAAAKDAKKAGSDEAKTTDKSGKPLENPMKYVEDQLAKIHQKYDGADVKYGRSMRPDGTIVETHTAADYSTLTKTQNETGANTLVVHDQYRRPQFEQETAADGSWVASTNSYNDTKGRTKPFPSEKLSIYSDGRMARSIYTNMGAVESKLEYTV